MLDHHQPRFESLSPEAVPLVQGAVARRHPQVGALPPAGSGLELFTQLQSARLHHAEVVMSLAGVPGPAAARAIEALIGRPITRQAPPPPPRRSRTARSDPRVITLLVEGNPKKEGSAAHHKFSLYRTGMTADEFVAAGGTRADLRHDTASGFIRMDAPP